MQSLQDGDRLIVYGAEKACIAVLSNQNCTVKVMIIIINNVVLLVLLFNRL